MYCVSIISLKLTITNKLKRSTDYSEQDNDATYKQYNTNFYCIQFT